MKIAFFVLLTFLAIVGVSHIVFEIYSKLTKFENDGVCLVLFKKSKDFSDLEFSVRSMITKAKKLKIENIICLTDSLDDYDKKVLSLLKKDYPYLTLAAKEDLIKKAGL